MNPKPHGVGAKPKLDTQQLAVVAQLVEQNNDATLLGASHRTPGNNRSQGQPGYHGALPVRHLKLTRKKNSLSLFVRDTERVQQLRGRC